MNTISTGEPNVLGTWLKIATALAGPDSKAVKFFQAKIADSPHGENEKVIADETQLMHLIGQLIESESAI